MPNGHELRLLPRSRVGADIPLSLSLSSASLNLETLLKEQQEPASW